MRNLKVLTTHVDERFGAARDISDYLSKYFTIVPRYDDVVILGIGTDKCIGDCLGPLVGTILQNKNIGFPVYGTLRRPLHALNLKERVSYIKAKHPDSFIIAIDACLGEDDDIGTIQTRNGPIDPGKGVGKNLPSVGDLSIIGIVEKLNNNGASLHNIRLSFVLEMAEIITEGIIMGLEELRIED